MIPVCLNLRNFMSYTDVHEPLRFEGIHVAVLSGDNGHGKSALLDAITWALWGRSRARSVDDLIHAGATEMEVEYEFLLDGLQYRVVRKRQKKGKSGLSDLQFAVLTPQGYRPLTERSVSETERVIQQTLKMSYETFINSSFIQQGKADSFTTQPPAERKRILGEILDLGYFDELETKAREAYREREAQLGEERTRAKEWEQEVAKRSEYQVEADRLAAEWGQVSDRVREVEAACNVARERVARLEAARRQLDEAEERLMRLAADRERARTNLKESRTRLAEVQAVTARSDAIERAMRELKAARAQLEEIDRKASAYLPLVRVRDQAEGVLKAEEARLESDLKHLMRRLTESQQAATGLDAAERALRDAAAKLEELDALAAERQHLQDRLAECHTDLGEKRATKEQLKREMLALKAQMDELAGLTTCPTCQRPMDDSHKARLERQYKSQGEELRDRFRTHERAQKELDAAVAAHEGELKRLDAALVEREPVQRRFAAAESAISQARQAQERAVSLQQEVNEMGAILSANTFAPAERQALAEVERKLTALAYDQQLHDTLRARARELAGAEAEQQKLEQARISAEHLAAQVRDLGATVGRLDEDCTTEQERCDQLRKDSARLGEEREALQRLDAELREAQKERDRLNGLQAQAQNRVDYSVFLEKRLKASVARQDALIREQGIFGELAHAFGKRGVQAMIIETALPEIENEANRLLARMTDGRMNVTLETQRDARSGSGVIETLDIKIADELGTRSYEMFSGGEAFRVNFAIRVALSKLLARRAGTKLQLLVVDEGFGSQDQEGRDRIVEAIQAIQDEFEKILVITHLEDLRERFPVRIEVRKTPRGSVYALR